MQVETRENIGYKIRSGYASLRKSEQRVADYVLNHERICGRITLEELARRSEVSQPTVMRFVKALGYDSFKEFRYQMMEESLREPQQENGNLHAMHGYLLEPSRQLKLIPAKVVATSVNAIEDMLKSISGESFEQTIRMLAKARRITLCCVENSSATARDLQVKLLYLGYDCRYDADYYVQQIQAAALGEEDVMIGISYSGQSRDTVDVMKTAKKAGAQTICITNFRESRISKWSDVVLCCSQEQWMYGDSIFSRTTQMVMNDMIYMGLLANDYEQCTGRLDENSRLIRNKAYREEK